MWTKAVMTKLGLSLNEAKTSIRDAWKERFAFFGTCSGRTTRGRMGPVRIWARAYPRRVCSGSGRRSERTSYQATNVRGLRCVTD